MARLKMSIGVDEIRGKVSNVIFSRCQSGLILFKYTKPRVNTGAFNSKSKNAVQSLSSYWINLTAAQKLAWTNQASLTTFYNSLGQPFVPTGYQLFSAINTRIVRSGSAPILNAVEYKVLTNTVAPPSGIVLASNTLSLGFNPTAVANSKYMFYCLPPCNKSYLGSNPAWRFIAAVNSLSQTDTTLLPIVRTFYGSKIQAGYYLPFLQLSVNTTTGVITRLGLPSLILMS